jgi:D-3-phosphoglycerate dehydrogenase / 2-oxoglutarate reductase
MSPPAAPAVVLLTGDMEAGARARIEAVAEVRQVPDMQPATLRAWVREAEVLVVRAQLPDDLFEHAPRLRGVVRQGVGLDMIPMEAATARGLPVANVPGSNSDAVAEYVFTCLGELRRRVARMDALLRTQGWSASRALSAGARELRGATLGIIGVGSVGTRIAEIGHHGFRMRVLGHQRRADALPPFVQAAGLDELLTQSDAVVLACPLTPATRGLLDARRLALMRPGACLVNVARGPVIDGSALVDALSRGAIAAALDVFDTQPLPAQHPLLSLDNVLLSPHAAGLTVQSMLRMSEGAADEVLRLVAGESPLNWVNRPAGGSAGLMYPSK